MAKTSGLGATIIVADSGAVNRTISNDCGEFTISTPRAQWDVTGVDKSAHERILTLADYSFSLKGFVNPAANQSHAVFSTITSGSIARSTSVAPTSNGSTPILVANLLYSDYQITRAATGDLPWDVKGDLADGAVPTWA